MLGSATIGFWRMEIKAMCMNKPAEEISVCRKERKEVVTIKCTVVRISLDLLVMK